METHRNSTCKRTAGFWWNVKKRSDSVGIKTKCICTGLKLLEIWISTYRALKMILRSVVGRVSWGKTWLVSLSKLQTQCALKANVSMQIILKILNLNDFWALLGTLPLLIHHFVPIRSYDSFGDGIRASIVTKSPAFNSMSTPPSWNQRNNFQHGLLRPFETARTPSIKPLIHFPTEKTIKKKCRYLLRPPILRARELKQRHPCNLELPPFIPLNNS